MASQAVSAQRPPSGGGGGTSTPSGPAINPDDYFESVDHNGVDLSNGQRLSAIVVDGGAAGTLTWRRGFNWEFWLHYYPTGERGTPEKWEINDGLQKHIFRSFNTSQAFHSSAVDGSTLVQQADGDYLFTDRDGNTILFPEVRRVQGQQDRRYARYKQMANGIRYTVRSSEDLTCPDPRPGQIPNPVTYTGCYVWVRDIELLGVETSDGYFVKIDKEPYTDSQGNLRERVVRHVIGNNNSGYCDVQAASCTLDQWGTNWLERVYSTPASTFASRARDKLGRERYSTTSTAADGRSLSNLIDFGRPASDPLYSIDNTQYTDNVAANPSACGLVGGDRKIGVQRFITGDGTSTYNIREGACGPTLRIAEAEYPDGSSAYVVTSIGYGGSGRPTTVSKRPSPGASTTDDGVNRITHYEWSSRLDLAPIANVGAKEITNARLLKVTFPESNYIEYDYDDRRNVIAQRVYPKPSVGGDVLTTTLVFPATCTNWKTCNKPNSVTDPEGNTTDHTYSPDHGGMLTVTGPADDNGIRPQTRYEYTQRYAYYLQANGSYGPGPTAKWLLTREAFCRTTSAVGNGCAGGATDEVVTTYDYGPNSGPNNLWLRGVVVTADGQSLRICYQYDKMGRLVAETQPKGTGGTCP